MNLEGILIHKTPYKDRDIIGRLLLRSGKVVDLYFYGGRGGGKLQKGSILEIGYMLKVTLAPKRKKGVTAMDIAKEWSLLWEAKHIRKNFHAFYLLSFFFELTNKVALEFDPELDSQVHQKNEEQVGIFKIISNGVFYLDKDSEKENLNIFDHLLMLLGKLTNELGILPDLNNCLYCQTELDKAELMRFEPQNGGFTCSDCLVQGDKGISGDKKLFEDLKASKEFRKLIVSVLSLKFSEVTSVENASRASCDALFNYFCYQFSYQKSDFKAWNMLVAL